MPDVQAGLINLPAGIAPERLLADLPPAEHGRYQSMTRSNRRAQQYLASRWLLRAHLACELDMQPADIPLRSNTGAAPALPGTRYRLGLSHSGAMSLCVSSTRADVGCDVECRQPGQRMNDMAARFFHPAEAQYLAHAPADHIQQNFHRMWTLKEASLKALGRGIADGLDSPAFEVEPDLRCLSAPSAASWTFACCDLNDRHNCYSLALAIAGKACPMQFTIHDYTPALFGQTRQRCPLEWHHATFSETRNTNRVAGSPPSGSGS